MRHLNPLRFRAGFTRSDFLAVVAIVSVLTSMLVPMVAAQRQQHAYRAEIATPRPQADAATAPGGGDAPGFSDAAGE